MKILLPVTEFCVSFYITHTLKSQRVKVETLHGISFSWKLREKWDDFRILKNNYPVNIDEAKEVKDVAEAERDFS